MEHKVIIAGVVAGLVVLAGGLSLWRYHEENESAQIENIAPLASSTIPTTKLTVYTAEEVAGHASETSCWTIVHGDVYDVTSFITKHPGGNKAILSLCGKDGTEAFNAEHGMKSKPNSTLAKFRIGTTAQ